MIFGAWHIIVLASSETFVTSSVYHAYCHYIVVSCSKEEFTLVKWAVEVQVEKSNYQCPEIQTMTGPFTEHRTLICALVSFLVRLMCLAVDQTNIC